MLNRFRLYHLQRSKRRVVGVVLQLQNRKAWYRWTKVTKMQLKNNLLRNSKADLTTYLGLMMLEMKTAMLENTHLIKREKEKGFPRTKNKTLVPCSRLKYSRGATGQQHWGYRWINMSELWIITVTRYRVQRTTKKKILVWQLMMRDSHLILDLQSLIYQSPTTNYKQNWNLCLADWGLIVVLYTACRCAEMRETIDTKIERIAGTRIQFLEKKS